MIKGNRNKSGWDGLYQEFFENGNLKFEKTYFNGELNGPYKEYHSNGQIILDGIRKNGLLDGLTKEFWENGNKFLSINYKNGKWDGECIEYSRDEKDKIVKKGFYKNGVELQ